MKESLLQALDGLETQLEEALAQAQSESDLLQIKGRFLGKKGELAQVLSAMGRLSAEERPQVGVKANQVKEALCSRLQSSLQGFQQKVLDQALASDHFDITLPGVPVEFSSMHPLIQVLEEINTLFRRLGFEVRYGPEIEDEYHNFEALNIPEDHPARDEQDTFYLKTGRLLRTHTSTVQIRVMETEKPPIKMIAPGTVYRSDHDLTHSPMFHQVEGLWVDRGIHFGHLKGVLKLFVKSFFGSETNLRFRASYFPFTEPSAELDVSCVFCHAKKSACPVCKDTGWLEVLGCGMVDPNVFEKVGLDPQVYSGFAFGMGVERMAMLKLGIPDLRLFFENDLRFLKQF
ncbi:MAG: phenylalanine--tRNA ligase subunit alpha [Deltaproteobacteria bacterium]|nr:phenylalanine--tRNA ligase subunit alpha [Deltaproteobacteria bacterium]